MVGQGGMGKVYEAVHEFTLRNVALKILNSSFTADNTNVTRFFQEVRALAKLNHPNIVTLYNAGKGGRRYYFSMELVDGPSLAQYVREKKFLRERQALAITRAAAHALGYAHKKNIIHRDVKPENILMTSSGAIKITDFGVVMHRDEDHLTLTREGFMVGSIYFVSPEQSEGSRDIDGRSDIYSLGVTLYFMLTGRMAFEGDSVQEIFMKKNAGTWVSPRRFNPMVSHKTSALVRKMMKRNRDKRYQSMDEVIAAIDGHASFRRSVRIALALICGALLVAAGIAVEALMHISGMVLR
jgi:serine/threonine protein kinase